MADFRFSILIFGELAPIPRCPMTMMPWFSKRNPRVFVGEHISVTRRDDGTLRLNFRPLKTDGHFSVERYALAVYNEICMALYGLVEE